jgi:hypothetical protein
VTHKTEKKAMAATTTKFSSELYTLQALFHTQIKPCNNSNHNSNRNNNTTVLRSTYLHIIKIEMLGALELGNAGMEHHAIIVDYIRQSRRKQQQFQKFTGDYKKYWKKKLNNCDVEKSKTLVWLRRWLKRQIVAVKIGSK